MYIILQLVTLLYTFKIHLFVLLKFSLICDSICLVDTKNTLRKGNTKMKRKLLLPAMAGTIMLSLTGCGHEHVWVEATCSTPKTCSECGETEGEVADHKWIEATCEKAKYCEVCGETDGEPLSHEWLEATYEEPKTCSLCGLTEGESLPAPYGIENNITFENLQDMELPFAMAFKENGQIVDKEGMWIETENAKISFGEITSKPSEMEGYTDITIPYQMTFSATVYQDIDIYSGSYGWGLTFPKFSVGDYYTGLVVPDRSTYTGGGDTDFLQSAKTYEWNGNVYSIGFSNSEETSYSKSDWDYNGNIAFTTYNFKADETYVITIPNGFDGAVFYIERNGSTEVNSENNYTIEETEEYILDEEHGADYYIFYRLSDIINN